MKIDRRNFFINKKVILIYVMVHRSCKIDIPADIKESIIVMYNQKDIKFYEI